jgi:hypothetical protein
MAKQKETPVGSNIVTYRDGSMVWFGVDLDQRGTQTKNSQGFNQDGTPKNPQEMVASTRAFTVVPNTEDGERVMIHFTRPMEKKVAITQKRRARAEAELDEEETQASADAAKVKKLAKKAGLSLPELAELLKENSIEDLVELLS